MYTVLPHAQSAGMQHHFGAPRL